MKFLIKKNIIETIIGLARLNYPKEFVALLEGKKEKEKIIIDKLIYQHYFPSETSAFIKIDPFVYINIYGTVHSHPSINNKPSKADLTFFAKYPGIHLIISLPFDEENIKAYDMYGNEIKFEIIK